VNARVFGPRIRYLRENVENWGGCGQWFRYLAKMTSIRVVWQRIADRLSDSSVK